MTGPVSAPNLSDPSATLAHTLPRLRSSNTRSSSATLLPTGGPVHTWPRVEPDDELPPCGGLPAGPFQWGEPFNPDDLRPDPADGIIYDQITEIHRELAGLGELRTQWRFDRSSIYGLWIAVGSGLIVAIAARWPVAGLVAVAFAVLAARLAQSTDISAARGRMLEEKIARLIDRRRELMRGES